MARTWRGVVPGTILRLYFPYCIGYLVTDNIGSYHTEESRTEPGAYLYLPGRFLIATRYCVARPQTVFPPFPHNVPLYTTNTISSTTPRQHNKQHNLL